MMTNMDEKPLDEIVFLARAESRVRILEYLLASDSATQGELRTRLEASRTTISRALQSLTVKGWIETSDGQYHLTRSGELIAAAFSDLIDTVEAVDELAEFLEEFPAKVEAPDFLGASNTEITYRTDSAPYAPAEKQSQILHTADEMRMLLPAIDLPSTKTITEQVTQRGLVIETIVPPGVESVIESGEFAPLMCEKMKTGRSSVYVVDTEIPLYIGLTDGDLVQIGLADEEGVPTALLETTDEAIREWAEEMYKQYREQSRPKPVEEIC
jgi:predicted transcriptional regulator